MMYIILKMEAVSNFNWVRKKNCFRQKEWDSQISLDLLWNKNWIKKVTLQFQLKPLKNEPNFWRSHSF